MANKKQELVEITFIKSPTGAFGLAYSVGNKVEMEAEQARELIEAGFAVQSNLGQPNKRTATAKPKGKETR